MEEVQRSEAGLEGQYTVDLNLLLCSLCNEVFARPTTLSCGHSFCHQCLIASISRKMSENTGNRAMGMIPICPSCHSIIWRPLASLKENVTLSALVARFAPKDRQRSAPVTLAPECEVQFHILIECASHSNTLLPHCYTQIVFATAFIDEIIEQQAQSNLVVLRWPGAEENTGIAGRLLRPETYHYLMNAGRFETVYKATFEGRCFVNLLDWQELDLKVSASGYSQKNRQANTSPLMLCQFQQRHAINHLSMAQFAPFFEVYDKLNNPVYLRQISLLVDEKILHQRIHPQKLIYCVMRLLRMSEKEVGSLAKMMDDQLRWVEIEDYLVKNASRSPVEVIKIQIPGNYPHALVFALLITLIVFHYMAK